MQTENRTVQQKDIQEFDIAEAIALMADEVKTNYWPNETMNAQITILAASATRRAFERKIYKTSQRTTSIPLGMGVGE